jgi:hypothetical protein
VSQPHAQGGSAAARPGELERFALELGAPRPDQYIVQLLVEHELDARRQRLASWRRVVLEGRMLRGVPGPSRTGSRLEACVSTASKSKAAVSNSECAGSSKSRGSYENSAAIGGGEGQVPLFDVVYAGWAHPAALPSAGLLELECGVLPAAGCAWLRSPRLHCSVTAMKWLQQGELGSSWGEERMLEGG